MQNDSTNAPLLTSVELRTDDNDSVLKNGRGMSQTAAYINGIVLSVEPQDRLVEIGKFSFVWTDFRWLETKGFLIE